MLNDHVFYGRPLIGKIRNDEVKLIAWLKRGVTREENGITILNKGCIPIPSWAKLDD